MFDVACASASFIATTLVIPIGAAVVMSGIEGLVESFSWTRRSIEGGWDLCVLALGNGAGLFGLPDVVQRLGPAAVTYASVASPACVGAGVMIMHIRKTPPTKLTAWHGIAAVLCGVVALTPPWYFVKFC